MPRWRRRRSRGVSWYIDVHLVFIDSQSTAPLGAAPCIVPRKHWVDSLSLPAKGEFNARGGHIRIGEAHLRPTNDALDFLRTPALLKRQIKARARASGSYGTSVAAASFRTARLEAQEASTKRRKLQRLPLIIRVSDVAVQLHFHGIPPYLGEDGSFSTSIALHGGVGRVSNRCRCWC